MKFSNPSVVKIHPLNGDLYVLDENLIYRIRSKLGVVELIVGEPSRCNEKGKFDRVSSPIDLTFDQNGDLLILEKNAPFVKVVRSSSNRMSDLDLNLNVAKKNFVSIDYHLDGSILLTNLGSKEIVKVKTSSLPIDGDLNGLFQIHSDDKKEIFIFNRLGQHKSTIDAFTGPKERKQTKRKCFSSSFSGETIFNFSYDSTQNSFGKLESIQYRNGQSLALKYDYSMRINDVVRMPIGQKLKVRKTKGKFSWRKNVFFSFRFIFPNKNFSRL